LLSLALVMVAPYVAYRLQQLRLKRPLLRRLACMGAEEYSPMRQTHGRCSGVSLGCH
jgi:hypothetical protein